MSHPCSLFSCLLCSFHPYNLSWLLPGRKKKDEQKRSLHEASSFYSGIGVFPKHLATQSPKLYGKLGRHVNFPALLTEGRGNGRRDRMGIE